MPNARIGIDLGGTKIEGIVLARDGGEIVRRRITAPQGDYDRSIAALADLVAELETSAGMKASVGIGMPGSISPATGLVQNANSVWLNGRPLNAADVREPQLVGRGSIVTMTYRTENLVITAHGKARENGTAGDVVRVQNLNSGKTVEAVVTGPDTVTVQSLTLTSARCATCP